MQGLRLRLTRAHDEERAHLARELHDDISQRLALVALQLAEQASWDLAPTRIRQMDASRKLVDEILTDIDRLSRRIHPSQLEHVGLVTALGSLCNEFTRRNGIAVDFDHGGVPDALPIAIKVCLYRVAQEAIRNAERHSGADRVRVVLTASSSAIGCCVSDSGRGFSLAIDRRQRRTGPGWHGRARPQRRRHAVGSVGRRRRNAHRGVDPSAFGRALSSGWPPLNRCCSRALAANQATDALLHQGRPSAGRFRSASTSRASTPRVSASCTCGLNMMRPC